MDFMQLTETALYVIIGTLGLALFAIVFGLIYKGIDRKLAAHMQGRIGPPIKQPFLDVKKLFTKENIIPDNAIEWIFNLAPVITFVGAITILIYLPLIPQNGGGMVPLVDFGGDLILILYLLMIPSLGMVIGGLSSGSPYATVGAQREMVTMISYEFPLAIIAITIAWRLSIEQNTANIANVFSFATISQAAPVWSIVGPLGFIGFLLLLFVLILVTPAELSKIPFDAPEAETEIAEGLMVEYSGRNYAMFYLADGVKTVAMASLIVALFFPYHLSPVLGLTEIPAMAVDIAFFLAKVFLIILFSLTLIRVSIARLKIDQIVYTYWVPLTLIALVGLICVMWDVTTMAPASEGGFGWSKLVEILGLV